MMQIAMASGLHEGLTVGVSDAVHIGHWLAALVQDLHLLAHRHKASPVCLSIDGGQVQSLQTDRQVVRSVALVDIGLWTGIMQLEWIFSIWDISKTKGAPEGVYQWSHDTLHLISANLLRVPKASIQACYAPLQR